MVLYDVIIVGAGIAGLYAAYVYKKAHPAAKILVLEKNAAVGGRMGNEMFYGSRIAIGAGIGRRRKDHLLQRLLADLHVPVTHFRTDKGFAPALAANQCDSVKENFEFLKKKYIVNKDDDKTFKAFAEPLLGGTAAYQQFVVCAGYSDFEHADVRETLFHYGFEDNYESFEAFGVAWASLLEQLCHFIGPENIKVGAPVVKVSKDKKTNLFNVVVAADGYTSKKVVLATTVEGVRRLLGLKMKYYRHIRAQPFLRIYGKFAPASIPVMAGALQRARAHTVVLPGPLHKLIAMNEKTGVYMVAYTDNMGALQLKKFRKNTAGNRAVLCRLLEAALGVPAHALSLEAIRGFYWPEGTHYYTPLPLPLRRRKIKRRDFIYAAQRPRRNLFVVGEMISRQQGWVEGALESVEKIRRDLLL